MVSYRQDVCRALCSLVRVILLFSVCSCQRKVKGSPGLSACVCTCACVFVCVCVCVCVFEYHMVNT